ncbi:MAG TPA: glycosyltransferase family 4 protein [Gryllotalpicola sp.]
MADSTVYFVVPDGIDDAERVSGGNVYDRRIRDELRARGRDVRMVLVPEDRAHELTDTMSALPEGALVLIDGLIAVAAPEALGAHTARLRIVVLAHMVAGALAGAREGGDTAERERIALRAAQRVIATSEWTRSELLGRGLSEADRVAVAHPGTDAAPAATGSEAGLHLLCVGAVAAHKGQDVLVEALAGLVELPGWSCSIVGSMDVEPDFVDRMSAAIGSAGLSERIALTGVLTARPLTDAYDTADLVVAPSRAESYGMVVAEALARGIPVVATRVGGLPEAIAGNSAGTLVPPDDPWALRMVLRQWCADPARRTALTAEARANARATTRSWGEAAETVAAVLDGCRAAGERAIPALGRRSAG